MSIRETLFLIIGVQTLVSFLLLFFYRSKKIHVNRYLGLFFASLFIELLLMLVHKYYEHPSINYIPFKFNFLALNFLFFYATETTGIDIKPKFYYYIPAFIEFLVLSVIFILVLNDSNIHQSIQQSSFQLIYRSLTSVYMILFSILIIRVNLKHQKLLPIHFSNTKYKSLWWLTILCVACICLHIFRHLYHTFGLRSEYISVAYCSIALLSLYYATISSLVQINIDNVIPSQKEAREGKEHLESILKDVSLYLKENKSYLNPEINLKNFAKEINLTERLISRAINRIENKNFNNYINHYRVEEFKRLLLKDEYKKYSISAIADEVGFSSRASFYKNFKEIAGVSPSDFVKRRGN